MNSQIDIRIKNFRAIRNAEISLNGITVVAGENGSGKSTISKLLYQIYKTSNDYESIVKLDSYSKMRPHLEKIVEIERLISTYTYRTASSFDSVENLELHFYLVLTNNGFFPENLKDKLMSSVNKLKNEAERIEGKRLPAFQRRLSRYIQSLTTTNGKFDSLNYIEQVFWVLDSLYNNVAKELEQLGSFLEKRPITILNNTIKSCFNSSSLPKELELSEHSSPLIDRELKRLDKSIFVKKQIYIDTPMSVGVSIYVNESTFSHWRDLNGYLGVDFKHSASTKNNSTLRLLEDSILHGSIELGEDNLFISEKFIYKRKDGLEINLLDCATGLKSFAILQLLYKNGTLGKDTLVIIDEPEAHLHPQWVVEYARLIVLLNKEAGTKFFLASHHPDMISAIKYISEKEGTDSNLQFYLAEKVADSYMYDYKSCGLDIEPIFESFNIALDRINQYGS